MLLQIDGIQEPELAAITTTYKIPEDFYRDIDLNHSHLQNRPWYNIEDREQALDTLDEHGLTPSYAQEEEEKEPADIYQIQETDGTTERFQFLGQDTTDLLHYYRCTPEAVELLHVDHETSGIENRESVPAVNHKGKLEEYAYQHEWSDRREIEVPEYQTPDAPEFDPELNQHFGGTIHLNENYRFPFRMPFDTVGDLLLNQTSDRPGIAVDHTPQWIDVLPEPDETSEKYRLHSKVRGHDHVTGTRIVDEIQVLDRGTEYKLKQFDVDDLARDHFIDQLSEVDSFDDVMAEQWIDEYRNLRTASWAVTSDVSFAENNWDVSCVQLYKEFGDTGVYRNEHSADAGHLRFPSRRADEISEQRQEQYFGEVLEPEPDGSTREDKGEQAGFDDFEQ